MGVITSVASSHVDAPLLAAEGLRVRYDGALALDGVDAVTRGDRVVLVGDVGPMVRLLSGTSGAHGARAAIDAGALRLLGEPIGPKGGAGASRVRGRFGAVPVDTPFPRGRTLRAYLHAAATLVTGRWRGARDRADDVIERLELTSVASVRLDRMDVTARCVSRIALAVVMGAEAILVHEPLAGLSSDGAEAVLGVLARAVATRRALVAMAEVRLETPAARLLPEATDVLVFRGGRLLLHVPGRDLLDDGRVYILTTLTEGEALAEALRAHGAEVSGGPLHFALTMPTPGAVAEVLRHAHDVGAAVITCEPLLGAARGDAVHPL
ncbi:MAG: hypothetical protein AAGN82_09730 [Myxococcota bacterium]